jgi:sigma-B regulation protein RsbU (phosphoserine phosphatase)
MAQFFQTIFVNPLWAKWVAVFALYLFTRNLSLERSLHVAVDFRRLVLVFFFSDALWAVLGLTGLSAFQLPLLILQQVFATGIYLSILTRYTKQNYLTAVFLFMNAVFFLLALAGAVFTFPWFTNYLESLLIIFDWAYVGYNYYQVSQYNTPKAGVILAARGTLIKLTVTLHILIAILVPWGGYQNIAVQTLLIPLSYLVNVWVFSFWERWNYKKIVRRHNLIKKDLAAQYEFMTKIGTAITEKLDIDQVLAFVVKSAVKVASADGGAIFLVDEFDDVLRVKAVEGDFPPPFEVPEKVKLKIATLSDYFSSTPIPLGQTVVGECAASGKTLYIRDSKNDPRMVHNSRLDQLFVSSIVLTPLMQGKKVFGVLAVVSKKTTHLFTKEQMEQIKTFGDYTSLTINSLYTYLQLLEKQEMEREVGIAAEIQGQLLPSHVPKIASISLAAYSLPAKGVSGDYYDIINIRKGQVLLTVCDVAGKGIPASLVMVMIRTIIHLVAHQPTITVSRILDIVNWGIAGRISLDRFATVAMLTYDFSSHRLEYSNAAHHPLLIFRASEQTFESFDTEGIPIGLERKTRYTQINTTLYKGDILILYTDGIIEAMDEKGRQYTLESLQKVIQEHAGEPPEKLKKMIIADVDRFVGKAKQHDDQTFVLMRVEH